MLLPRRLRLLPLLLLSALPAGVLGGDVLSTTGFSQCVNDPSVKVTKLDVTYDKNTRQLNFDVAGISKEVQKVKATLVVSAYGKEVYSNSFNPCEKEMQAMCPCKLVRNPVPSFLTLTQISTREQFLLARNTNHTRGVRVEDSEHSILSTRSGRQRKAGADEC